MGHLPISPGSCHDELRTTTFYGRAGLQLPTPDGDLGCSDFPAPPVPVLLFETGNGETFRARQLDVRPRGNGLNPVQPLQRMLEVHGTEEIVVDQVHYIREQHRQILSGNTPILADERYPARQRLVVDRSQQHFRPCIS